MGIFPDFGRINTAGLYDRQAHDSMNEGIPLPSSSTPGGKYLADLMRVPIDYIFEIYDNGELVAAVSSPNTPNMIRVNRTSATQMTWTMGIAPIREHTHNRMLVIDMKGQTGVSTRQGYSRNGKLITKPGLQLMLEFDAFLDMYQQLAETRGASNYAGSRTLPASDNYNGQTYMVFRALDENLHVRVEPKTWEFERDAGRTRKGADWSLTLTAYDTAQPKKPGGLFGPLQDYLDYATGCINGINNCLQLGNTMLKNANSSIQGLRAPLRALSTIGSSFRDIAQTAGSIADFPRAAMADLVIAAGQFKGAMEDVKRIGDSWDYNWADENGDGEADHGPSAQLRNLDALSSELYINSKSLCGFAGIGPQGHQAARDKAAYPPVESIGAASDDTPYTQEADLPIERGEAGDLVSVTVSDGADAETIAALHYGSKGASRFVMSFNKMADKNTYLNGRPLTAGDVLFLPGTGKGGGGMFASTDLDIREMYGRDLYLEEKTGDLVITDDATDVFTILGPENLEQATRHRCVTPLATSRNFPKYGLPAVPGTNIGPNMLGYLGARINEQMRRDKRVRNILGLSLLDQGDTLAIGFTVIPELGSRINVIADLEQLVKT